MIELKSVSKVYQSGEVQTVALNAVSLTITEGSFVVILGPSGSGKSTLLNVLSGLDHPTSGEIHVFGTELSTLSQKALTAFRRENLGFIFQQYNLLSTLTVYENIALGHHLGNKRISIDEMLELVGLTSHKDKYPFQLSGGEQQRVSIARALIKEPRILFCDEPTGALDEENGKNILALLQDLNQRLKTTIVLITHNPHIAKLADAVIKMNSGKVVETQTNTNKLSAEAIAWS